MESSHKVNLVKPGEWILLVCATVLLTAAVTNQRSIIESIPAEAKMEIPSGETSPSTDTSANASTERKMVAALVSPAPAPALYNAN